MSVDHGFLFVTLFLLFMSGCLFVSMWASPDFRPGDTFFRESGEQGWLRTGLAYAGDFAPAASTLYLIGIVAIGGTDGVVLTAGAAISPLLVHFFVVRRMPLGARSLGGALAERVPGPQGRRTVAVAAMICMAPLLIGQLIPMGEFMALTIGMRGEGAERVCVAVMGVLMISCTAIGATRGTTLLQVCKSASLAVVVPVLIVAVMKDFDWDLGTLVRTAEKHQGSDSNYLELGGLFGGGPGGIAELVSWFLGGVLGAAFVPYMLTRLSTAKDRPAMRRASGFGAVVAALLCGVATLLGFAVAALVGRGELSAAGPMGGNNVILLASTLDGNELHDPGVIWLVVSSAAFVIVLASVSVLLLSGAAALSRDLGMKEISIPVFRSLANPRVTLIALGTVGVVLAVLFSELPMQYWVTIGYSLAASSLAPAFIYAMSSRPFPVAALKRCVYGGLASNLLVNVFSQSFSGAPDSIMPGHDFALVPLHTAGLISVPLAFLLGAIRLRGDVPPQPVETEPAPGTDDEPGNLFEVREPVAAYGGRRSPGGEEHFGDGGFGRNAFDGEGFAPTGFDHAGPRDADPAGRDVHATGSSAGGEAYGAGVPRQRPSRIDGAFRR